VVGPTGVFRMRLGDWFDGVSRTHNCRAHGWRLVLAAGLVLTGCGTTAADEAAPDSGVADRGGGGSGGSDAPEWSFDFLEDAGDGWQVLLKAEWELEPHTERYLCVRFTAPEAASMVAFKSLDTPGTHHTVLGVQETPTRDDGIVECDGTLPGDRHLFGGALGSEASDPFPEGVAMDLQAGHQLTMNLHLFNVSDEPLTGSSGMLVQLGAAPEPGLAASSMLAGPLSLTIPPGHSVHSGLCTFAASTTLFAVAPHMHQLGTHLKAVAKRAGHPDRVLFDGPYDFDEQVGHAIDPITMESGDRVEVECSYDNPGDRVVRFGESSLEEMCFLGASFYPVSAHPGTNPCSR